MLRKPIYQAVNCNNNNLHEYSPYLLNIIDQSWWHTLTDYCKELIIRKTNGNFVLNNVKTPHVFQFDNKDKFLKTIYQSYIDSFDYHLWYPYVSKYINAKMIKMDKELLLNKQYDQLLKNINDILDGDYFVRMSSTSGKNEKYVRPFNKATDIIHHITNVKLFMDQEFKRDKDSYLILIPWKEIDIRYEFRLFVVNGKLTAVSQQSIQLFQYSSEELKDIEYALNHINFIKDCCEFTNTFIADVYVQDKICYLIELNPFGAHCGAGSGLFNWITDYNVLHGIEPAEFRYLSIINY